MDNLVPWPRLIEAWSLVYFPNSTGKRDRPGADAADLLPSAVVCARDEALEDAIYDSQAMRDFIGIDLAIGSVPDATTQVLTQLGRMPRAAAEPSHRAAPPLSL